MHATVCPTHGIILDAERAAHAKLHARAKTKQRTELEPWRALYSTKEWKRAQARTLRRDGHQCRIVENGLRCTATINLQAHHTEPLRDLYRTFERGQFVQEATNPDTLITVCVRHHRALERLAKGRGASHL